MAIQIQLRQGTTTEHNSFTGAVGEVTVDTTKDTLVVHDGVTVGGFPVASKANADGTISLIKKDGTSAGTINADGLFNNTLTSTNTNQALTAAQGKVLNDQAFGVGQIYKNVTAFRVNGATYTNTSSKSIFVAVRILSSSSATLIITVGGLIIMNPTDSPQYYGGLQFGFMVGAGSTYSIQTNSSIVSWMEF